MKNLLILLLLLLTFAHGEVMAQASKIKGVVYAREEKSNTPLPGANVYWAGTTTGTVTDINGNFAIDIPQEIEPILVVSFVGFTGDTINVAGKSVIKVVLNRSVSLKIVEIASKQQSTFFSAVDPINLEKITSKELLKAACCNLSESFETNASVDVSYSDAVTGSKEIQMLGLAGSYTLMQAENIPIMRGLGRIYGLNYIPGTWMDNIQISKGTGSVLNGYEAITGQINIEYKKPWESERLNLNVYGASTGNTELNVEAARQLNDNWSTMVMAHGEYFQTDIDHNHDSFLDMPKVKNYNVFNRWKYSSGGRLEAQVGVKVLGDERVGGQYTELDGAHGQHGLYKTKLATNRYEAFAKTGLVNFDKPHKSLGWINNVAWHDQDGYFGNNNYTGTQTSYYSNLIFQNIIDNTNHLYRLGASYQFDKIDENFAEQSYDRTEIVPGVFGEYTFTNPGRYVIVGGLRADYHNDFGWFATPRLHIKYDLKATTHLRLTAGKGTRVANLISDNVGVLASSRNIIVLEAPKQEVAWNFGTSLTHDYKFRGREGVLSLDYYYTTFDNQLIVDTYTDAASILFYNLDGKSYSNSFQAQLMYEPIDRLDVKAAYRMDKVVSTYNGVQSVKPLTARDKVLFNISYKTKFEKWVFDGTVLYTGRKKLPATVYSTDPLGENVSYSDPYVTANAQITRNFKKWSVYSGVENLTDYTQNNPIIGADDPFGTGFDATVIWAPLMGRKIYAGLRYKIK